VHKQTSQLNVVDHPSRARELDPNVSDAARGGRVLLMDMPFRTVRVGSLGLSTLKAILRTAGIESDIYYGSIRLAKKMGPRLYSYVSSMGVVRYSGEIFFTPHYYDLPVESFMAETLRPYIEKAWQAHHAESMLGPGWTWEKFLAASEKTCRELIPALISEMMAEIDWGKYDIIGFSLIFDQTLPSLMMAKCIKRKYPEKTIIFGGPSCDGDMGLEMLRVFPWIDVISVGEADLVILPLISALRERRSLKEIPGIALRHGGQVVRTGATPLLEDLNQLPIPDYDEFFTAIQGSEIVPQVFFETSRGCWWGQKHLCTFCGLNANGLQYRRKSADRSLSEIITLASRYECKMFGATDNILDLSFFKTVFPALKEWRDAQPANRQIELHYEMKSNVKKEQLSTAKAAGLMWAQPGIESFSDHVLQLMDKGATGIQQVQFIKWATELGISLHYGVLHGNPGENAGDYAEMMEGVEFFRHLHPPTYIADISLDRFSPYFKDPEKFGIRDMRPQNSYFQIFMEKDLNLREMAYRFEFDHDDRHQEELKESIRQCVAALEKWQSSFRHDTLTFDTSPDRVWILDRRSPESILANLTGEQAEIFLYCDEYHSLENIQERFASWGKEKVAALIDALHARKWFYKDAKGRCLALPIRRDLSALIARKLAQSSQVVPAGTGANPPAPATQSGLG
jgi:ribosomal peptide maturation radical SAM protein 1